MILQKIDQTLTQDATVLWRTYRLKRLDSAVKTDVSVSYIIPSQTDYRIDDHRYLQSIAENAVCGFHEVGTAFVIMHLERFGKPGNLLEATRTRQLVAVLA